MTETIRVGTRRSPLALAQTRSVTSVLARKHPDLQFVEVPLVTGGDRPQMGAGSWDFTDRIDAALEAGEIDFAVHSAKDLPVRIPRQVRIAACPRRADPRDCVVLREAASLKTLRTGARLGSSSVRRRAQFRAWRPDLEVVDIRGNIGTRLDKMYSMALDGVVLATAGLIRLGWRDRITERLPTRRMLPAPGQGALAVSVRAGDREVARLAAAVDDPATRAAVEAERAVADAIGGDCNLPLAALAAVTEDTLSVRAGIFSPDGQQRIVDDEEGPSTGAVAVGSRLGQKLAHLGRELLARSANA